MGAGLNFNETGIGAYKTIIGFGGLRAAAPQHQQQEFHYKPGKFKYGYVNNVKNG